MTRKSDLTLRASNVPMYYPSGLLFALHGGYPSIKYEVTVIAFGLGSPLPMVPNWELLGTALALVGCGVTDKTLINLPVTISVEGESESQMGAWLPSCTGQSDSVSRHRRLKQAKR